MPRVEDLEFPSPDTRNIYEFVEANGAVTPREVWDHLSIDPVQFHHELALLKRDGYLEKHDGKLRAVHDGGTEEEYHSDGLAFVIRPARQEDLSGVVGAIREVTEEKQYVVAETVAEQLDHEGTLLRQNERVRRMFFVGVVSDDVVAWAHLEAPRLEKLRHTAELTVGVLEEYRRHGIGSHLLQRGLAWAAANGYSKVHNSLPAGNATAIGFLLDNGFEVEAVRTDHYRTDRGYDDEVMLARTLDEGAVGRD